MATEQEVQEYLDQMRKERGGYIPAPHLYVAPKDLEFLKAYNNLYNSALQDGKELPIKYRELVAIAILAYRHRTGAVVNHIRRALQYGATKQEILDAIESTVIPGGAPCFGTALDAMLQVEEEEAAKAEGGEK